MSAHPISSTKKKQTCHAVQGALVCLALAAGIGGVQAATGEAPGSMQSAVQFSVPAGPLAAALTAFASDAGTHVSAPAELVKDVHTPGVTGRHAVGDALNRLLAGTGLEAIPSANGGYSLRRKPASAEAAGAAALPMVVVSADRDSTGTYTASTRANAATPLGLSIRETPQTVSVMTKQRMEDQGLTSLHQTLEQAPGLVLTSMGTERYYPVSRGYTVNNFQIDGLSTYAEYYGLGEVSPQGMADMAVYDSVEILRGASGLVTGAGNPSGAINLVRKKPSAEFQGEAELSAASWHDKRGMLDLSNALNDAGTLRGRMVATWQNGASFIDNYSRDKKLFYGVIEADVAPGAKLTLGLERQENRYKGQFSYVGFPLFYSNGTQTKLPRSMSSASRDNRLDIDSNTFFATYDQRLNAGWKLRLSANSTRSSQTDKVAYLALASGVPDQATGNGLTLFAEQYLHHIKTDSFDLNLHGPITLFGHQHELVFGADYNNFVSNTDRARDSSGLQGSAVNLYSWDRTGVVVPGASYMKYDSTRRQPGVYGAGRFSLSEQLKFILGAREFNYSANYVTRNSSAYYAAPQSGSSVFTPYSGLVYDINPNHSVYASYTVIYKPQTSQDAGGAFLDPVQGANYEAGLKSEWLGGGLQSGVSVYRLEQDNLAERDPGKTVTGTSSAAYRAVKGAVTQGIDLELTGALSPDWNIAASYSYSTTEDAGGLRIRTDFPKHLAKLWTTYRLPGVLSRMTIGGGINYQSGIYTTVNVWPVDRDLTWRQGGYSVTNLMARYDFSPKLSANLNLNNVFDKNYVSSIFSTYYTGMYGDPRNVALNLKYKF